MAKDSNQPTRRKHRRSPSEEDNDSEEPSKRSKHRHHRHHRHRHHHRSKKQDKAEDTTQAEPRIEIEDKDKRQEEGNGCVSDLNDGVATAPVMGAVGAVLNGSSLGIDYDMEEGEIIEEDEEVVGRVELKQRGFDLDVEVEGSGANNKVCSSLFTFFFPSSGIKLIISSLRHFLLKLSSNERKAGVNVN